MKKRRNKLVTLGMAAMMTAALMSGCGKKATPENLLKDMAKNMKDTESVVANMKMDMEMGDDTTTIGIQMDMDIDMDLKSGESHAKGAVDMKMMGTNVGTEIEMYTVKEKDQYIVYTMANDQWQKEEMDERQVVSVVITSIPIRKSALKFFTPGPTNSITLLLT